MHQGKKNSSNIGQRIFTRRVDSAGEKLSRRDGMGIEGTEDFNIKAYEDSKILVIDVPMSL